MIRHLLLVLIWTTISAGAIADDSPLSFSEQIRPVLANACFHCHGPDQDTRQADLRLDQKDGLFAELDGYTIVKPGSPDHSELVRRILSADPDEVMPPPDSNKTLTAEQRKLLAEWVRQGAPWEGHWSFIPPERPSLPQPKNKSWGQNEIDRFILRKIEAAGLTPSEQAGPYTLVRRLYLDLIGLPPSPEEADTWVQKLGGQVSSNESQPLNEGAWQELITHLLNSSHYGERWARRWLDLARYADTNGYEKDRDRSIWPYRDWVINAINSGMPFDRFTVEQLAGDMLPNSSVQQHIATGFHRNTMLNEEGGIDPLEFRFHAMTDRVATTGTTWLGLTLGCCQCHTHKYDPISHHEYYQLMAFLNNADEPSLELPDDKIEQQWHKNMAKADQLLAELPDKWPVDEFEQQELQLVTVTADGEQIIDTLADGVVQITGANPPTAIYTVEADLPHTDFDALRLTTSTMASRKGPGRTEHGNFVLSEIQFEIAPVDESDQPVFQKLAVTSATASVEQKGYGIKMAFDGDESTGWGIHGRDGIPQTAAATFQLDRQAPGQANDGPVRLKVTMKQLLGDSHTIAAFRITALRQRDADEIAALRAETIERSFEEWRNAEQPNAVDWQPLRPTKATSNLPILTIQDDDSIFASGDTAKRDDYYITLAAVDYPLTALRLEALPDERLPAGGPGSTYYEGTLGDFFLNEIKVTAGDTVFPIESASETFAKNRYGNNPASASLALDGDVQTGWSVHGRQRERHVAVFNFSEPLPPGTAVQVQMTFGRHFASSLGRFRFSGTASPDRPQARTWSNEIADWLRQPMESLATEGRDTLFRTFLMSAPELATHAEHIRSLRRRPEATSTLVMSERPAGQRRPTRRHHRGEYLQPRDLVEPGLPEVLTTNSSAAPKNRLQFARWLVSEQNPLTARVVVNRHWAAFFGTGLVSTLDDFGLQGAAPSHPELLDWLAVTFVQDDHWSLKDLHRRIVSSAAYRQSSVVVAAAKDIDPDNRLLSYAPRFRLEAEIVRDQLLAAVGVLSRKTGGPPVRPPQPTGVTEVAYGSPKWNASTGNDRYRRSIYTFVKRTAPFAMFATFDAPTGESCIAERTRSNSPLQALTLLNDVMITELAQHAGHRCAAEEKKAGTDELLTRLFRKVLVRPPTAEELLPLKEFLNTQRAHYSEHPDAGRKLLGFEEDRSEKDDYVADVSAWTATARVLFGLDETLNRE
ncbi:MAG: PSD1 and planctomycete cytochrome C domain-containing protein [Fuerstiella sp.]